MQQQATGGSRPAPRRAGRRARALAATAGLLVAVGGAVTGTQAAGVSSAAAVGTHFAGNGVGAYGDAKDVGDFAGFAVSSPLTSMTPTPDGAGYWVAAADGGVFAFGDAPFSGSMGGRPLFAPVVAMARTPDGRGYWLGAMDGGVFAYGDAPFLGSMGGRPLAQPIVGMAATPDGGGYWLVASDGGIFSFGDARFFGSMGGAPLDAPVAGMAPTADGRGYWMVGADGGIFSFGDAGFYGSAAGADIGTSVSGIAPTHDGKGYWLVAATAGVLTYGDATFYGPSPNEPPFSPTTAIAPSPDGKGYWLLQPDDVPTSFTDVEGPGSPQLRAAVAAATSQVGPDPAAGQGSFCNPYGPCEEWCALFATWGWEQAGVPIPRYAFTGDIDTWSAARGLAYSPDTPAQPGEGVLFGTGPQSSATSIHVGVVAEAWPDGAVITIEGDAGPEPFGAYAVVMDGPYLLTQAGAEIGMPVYAVVAP